MSSRVRVRSAILVAVVVGGVLAPSGSAVAVEAAPPAVGTGQTGSVVLTPTLAAGETVVPTSLGLGRPVETLLGEPSHNGGRSGTSSEPGDILVQGQVFVTDEALLRVDVTAADPSLNLRTTITFIEQGELEPSTVAVLEGPDATDRFDIGDPFYGLWLIDVSQVSEGAGVPFDVVATTTAAEAPLLLSPTEISASNPSLTAGWSGLTPNTTYLAAVQWGYWRYVTVIEVRTGPPQAVTTTTTARLNSSIQLPGRSTTLLAAVRSVDGGTTPGVLRLRIDGTVRSTSTIVTGDAVIRIPIPRLSPGAHDVKAEFRPTDSTAQPSSSPVRRLIVL